MDRSTADSAVGGPPGRQAYKGSQTRRAGAAADPGVGLGRHLVRGAGVPSGGEGECAGGSVEEFGAGQERVDVGTDVEQIAVGPGSFDENRSGRGTRGQERADARIAGADVRRIISGGRRSHSVFKAGDNGRFAYRSPSARSQAT